MPGGLVVPVAPQRTPPEFLEQLRCQIAETTGTTSKKCRHDRACKLVTCRDQHPNGRDFESDLETIICRFKRKCKRSGCFYVHPSGREIDEDPSKGMCMRGANCDVPDCFFNHPADRVAQNSNQPKCFTCGGYGHTQWNCGRKVRLSGFPPEWDKLE